MTRTGRALVIGPVVVLGLSLTAVAAAPAEPRPAVVEPIAAHPPASAEAAEVLEISEDNLKVRLHRARALVRKYFYEAIGDNAAEAFPFHLDRCNEIVKRVFKSLDSPQLPIPKRHAM